MNDAQCDYSTLTVVHSSHHLSIQGSSYTLPSCYHWFEIYTYAIIGEMHFRVSSYNAPINI